MKQFLIQLKQFFSRLWRRKAPPVVVSTPPPAPPKPQPKPQPKPEPIRKCLESDKFMFSREQAAKKREELLRRGTAPYLRIYCCPHCHTWHLTHKKPKL